MAETEPCRSTEKARRQGRAALHSARMRRGLRHSRADLRLPALRRPARNRDAACRSAAERGAACASCGRCAPVRAMPRDISGVWRYRELLPFDDAAPFVTLFEGNTPLYDAPRCAEYCGLVGLRLKHQGCNPTGSFKDTGMTAAVTQAVVLGARTAVCASTGNTAASLAAYAARAGLQAAILLPHGQISAAKLAQSMDYGAPCCEIDGNFDDCMRLIQELGDDPSIYVANSINPFRIEGQKTVAFELMRAVRLAGSGSCGRSRRKHGQQHGARQGFRGDAEAGLDRPAAEAQRDSGGGRGAARAPVRRARAEAIARGCRICPTTMTTVENPHTLATAIKIGAPVSWQKELARRAALARTDHHRERAGNRRRQSHDRPRRNRLRAGLGHHGGGNQKTRRRGAHRAAKNPWLPCSPATC